MQRNPDVLLLCSDERQTHSLTEILSKSAIVTVADDPRELKTLLKSSDYDVLLCAWSFRLGNWDDALQQVRQVNTDLPVIVFSPTGGEREWIQVLQAGGFDLLIPPYREMWCSRP